MKLPIETHEVLLSIYSPGEIAKARDRLRDTKAELARWEGDAAEVVLAREVLSDAAEASTAPEVAEFLENASLDLYAQLAAYEGKASTCRRRLEETSAFLRRAGKVISWTR